MPSVCRVEFYVCERLELQWSQDRQTLEYAFDAAQKALALDDTLPLAYVALATVYQ